MDFIYWFYILITILFVVVLIILLYLWFEPPRYYLVPTNQTRQVTSNGNKAAVLTTGQGIPFELYGQSSSYVHYALNDAILYGLPREGQVYVGAPPDEALVAFEYVNQQVRSVDQPTLGLVARGNLVTLSDLQNLPEDATSTWTYVAE